MLYNLNWLKAGEAFPPTCEVPRITRYIQNEALFDGDHFRGVSDCMRTRNGLMDRPIEIFNRCAERIDRIVGNFEDIISFPVLLNYQRLMSLKMADLVCGERPTVSGVTAEDNASIKDVRDRTMFDDKLYSTVLDISRYGDAIWRMYLDDDGQKTFTCWTPLQWFPVVNQDGTNSIRYHCICWKENISDDYTNPVWKLHVQIHGTAKEDVGKYTSRTYSMTSDGGTIVKLDEESIVLTGFDRCAIIHLRAYAVTNSVYGFDDYMNIDSLMAEIMERVGQISVILDKHADPSITGPVTMLTMDPDTGEYHLKCGKFFAVSQGEDQPKYLTWDGKLDSAFKQLEFLINQLYILSEMGAAILGGQEGSSTAISGTAMRFKMVNPLAKARRISNSMTLSVRDLFSSLCDNPVVDAKSISVFWADGLPDDPKENIENAKLASGEAKLMPLEKAIMEFFGRSNEEATQWIKLIQEETRQNMLLTQTNKNNPDDPNHPGPQDGTGVNSSKNGSETGLNSFHGTQN